MHPRLEKWARPVWWLVAILLFGGVVRADERLVTFPGGAVATFAYVPPGTFRMGGNQFPPDELPARQVTISTGYWIQTTDVTMAQWESVMSTRPWESLGDIRTEADGPAPYLSTADADSLTARLNRAEGQIAYKVPTEAQWEYACKSGDVDLLDRRRERLVWTADFYDYYDEKARVDPFASTPTDYRVLRGESCTKRTPYYPGTAYFEGMTSGYLTFQARQTRGRFTGIRLIRVVPPVASIVRSSSWGQVKEQPMVPGEQGLP